MLLPPWPPSSASRTRAGPSLVSTRDLVERAAAGDERAFSVLAAETSSRLLPVARRILRDRDLAEDAVQQTLVAVWSTLPGLRDPDKYEAWSHRIVVRAAVAELRRRPRSRDVGLRPDDHAHVSPEQDSFRSVEDRDRIERAFRALTREQRDALVLHHATGLSHIEIADALGIPVGTVGSRIHYATTGVRALLEADERAVAIGAPSA